MKKNFLLVLVLSIFLLTIFAGGALARNKSSNYDASVALPVDGGSQTPGAYFAPTPAMYEGDKGACDNIAPEVTVWEEAQWGSTYYDYQKNGSMGRMIAVGPGGYRHMVFHKTYGAYDNATFPRYVIYNCEDPAGGWLGPTKVDGGTNLNAGYTNIALTHTGRELVIYHRGTSGGCTWYSCLKPADAGYICQGYFGKIYDLPDLIEGTPAAQNGMWPKHTVVYDALVDTDYIHIVAAQNSPTAGADQSIGYERCVFQGNNLVCRSRLASGPVSYTVVPNVQGSPTLNKIGVFDTNKTISAIVVSSPAPNSRKVAIIYTKHRSNTQYNNEVYYIESTNNGNDWLDGTQWPPVKHNITNYPALGTERAYTDVAACYDYNDSLHIVWTGCFYDSVAGTHDPNKANLYHWSRAAGKVMIAPGQWANTKPGAWNRNISKMSISAKDPIYHPGGSPDSVFLFVTWTQFNPGDTSKSGYGNGDIYGAVSNDGGQTWTSGYNLTNTHSPNCLAGACLSEHWSSMAENMYNGHEHIEYVCDRDAGGIVQSEGAWTDNPMMYINVAQFPPIIKCGITYTIVDPPSWTDPPIKVSPSGTRSITLQVQGIYNLGGNYSVASNNAAVTITSNSSGFLAPNQTKTVSGLITCTGEGYIDAIITLHKCIGQGAPDEKTDSIRLVAICDDTTYYECKRHPSTYDITSTDVCSLWVCANTMEIVWDKRVPDDQGDPQRTMYSAGTFVATLTPDDEKIVIGRQEDNSTRALASRYLRTTTGFDPFEPTCLIKKIHTENTYIWYLPPMIPHTNPKWRWISISKQIIIFLDNGSQTCPLWKKCQIIKYYWIKYMRPPQYWPSPGSYPGHGDIYFGVYADPDAPADTSRGSANTAGWDNTRKIMWQHGRYNGQHPEYNDYYIGLALRDTLGAVVNPYAAKDVRNDTFIYPQSGWRDDQLFGLADTAGVWIQDPDSVVDRSMVLTAYKIPAGSDTTFKREFVLIEALIKGNTGTGLAELQAHVDSTSQHLIPELRNIGLFKKWFPICGDCTSNGVVDAGDLVCLLNYLFLHGPIDWPRERIGDVTGNGVTDAGDLVYLLNYLFVHGPAPHCIGM
jgi:hypothetical protein